MVARWFDGGMRDYQPSDTRYDTMEYRFCGRSGLRLPALSLGLWQNFGTDRPEETQRAILRRAFDRGVTHVDLANNYGPPYGRAEENLGHYLRTDFAGLRDELLISTKAGWDMWPGPYGQGGGSRKYVLASLDQSLSRMGLDYVDIFYSTASTPRRPSRRRCPRSTAPYGPGGRCTSGSPPTPRRRPARRPRSPVSSVRRC